MHIILTTQKAEIRRIEVRSLPGHVVFIDSFSKIPNIKQGWQSGSSDRVPS
jgi:hypothetical protein